MDKSKNLNSKGSRPHEDSKDANKQEHSHSSYSKDSNSGHSSRRIIPPPYRKNFKLLVDPVLKQGAAKLYRINGHVPGDPECDVTTTQDPRSTLTKIWARTVMDLPVPRFKIDDFYVGDPPDVEIGISNLNDNIHKPFLSNLIAKFGETEELRIFYHPDTNKHLGLARVVFCEISDATACVSELNGRSVMGKRLNVFLDPFGKECRKIVKASIAPESKDQVLETVPLPPSQLTNEPVDNDNTSPIKQEDDVTSPTEKTALIKTDSNVPQHLSSRSPVVDEDNSYRSIPPSGLSQHMQYYQYPPPPSETSWSRIPWNEGTPTNLPMASYPSWDSAQTSIHMGESSDNVPPQSLWTPWSIPFQQFMTSPDSPHPGASHLPSQHESQSTIHPNVCQGANDARASTNSDNKTKPPLDLDTRIEFLLHGPASMSNEISNPPLPPDDPPLPPPPPSPESTTPRESFLDADPDDYPVSTPPSPFISEEAYYENLLVFRLKVLDRVGKTDTGSRDIKDSEAVPKDKIQLEDDMMSLSSLSSNNDHIEEITVPTSPCDDMAKNHSVLEYDSEVSQVTQAPYAYSSDYNPVISQYEPHQYRPSNWHNMPWHFQPQTPIPSLMPRFKMRIPYNHMQRRMRFSRPWMRCDPYHNTPRYRGLHFKTEKVPQPVGEVDLFSAVISQVIDRICKLAKEKFENDLMKRFTEVVAYQALDKWWDQEESKHQSLNKEEDKNSADNLEKCITTEKLLNAIIDAPYDVLPSGSFGLGLRASLPKMPSFKRKPAAITIKSEKESTAKKEVSNESDQEEMVQLSDEDNELHEKKSVIASSSSNKKKSPRTRKHLSSTSSSDSSLSDSENSIPAHSDNDSVRSTEFAADLTKPQDDAVIPKKKEKSSSRLAMISLDFPSYSDSDDLSKPPKTPDIHLSDSDSGGLPRTPSPSGNGMFNFDDDLLSSGILYDDGDDDTQHSRTKIRTPSPTKKFSDDFYDEDALFLLGCNNNYLKMAKKKVKIKKISSCENTSYSLDSNSSEMPGSSKRRRNMHRKELKPNSGSHSSKADFEPTEQKIYNPRNANEQLNVCYEFFYTGIDKEDEEYMQQAYNRLLSDEKQTWLDDTHWVDTAVHLISHFKPYHDSGCARAQGYYKIEPHQKKKYKHHHNKSHPNQPAHPNALPELKTQLAVCREARSIQRRLQTVLGSESDLLKFNQLKFRKKLLKFGKSEIHDWGLFAMEAIAAHEMVIEYVGQVIRPSLADHRERRYEQLGIGSSYLFRIDSETIVDATKFGNLSRFINHSCTPNCVAKIITIEGEKKIVIYSKRNIQINEEITYDYKFPIEDKKIACLCSSTQCKGYLN